MKKQILAYLGFVVASFALFFWIISVGQGRFGATVAPGSFLSEVPSPRVLEHFILILIVVIAGAKLTGILFQYFRQPPVMGEVIAGIALGPSLLGALFPRAGAFLMPATVVPLLNMVAQIGVIIFMFIVGIELDKRLLRNKGVAAVAISHSSIVCPFLLGTLLALGLYQEFAPPGISFVLFALFMGVALSITAFPVLARILKDLRISATPIAALALTCAAVDDVTAWCLLALLIGVAKAHLWQAGLTFGLTALYAVIVWRTGRPLMKKFVTKIEAAGLSTSATVLMIVVMLSSALVTQMIGVHALFGAFLIGTLIPNDSRLGRELIARFEQFVLTFLLPLFFAFTGLRTQMGLLTSADHWLWCALIIVAAVIGKIGGATGAARAVGIGWRDSLAVGVLMNTRGLVELVILNVGLDLGILSPALFTMMVIMAVVTTLMTTPIFNFVTGASFKEKGLPGWKASSPEGLASRKP